ncbi:enoyl-CoA hydratase-related protein [Saccharopolyspora rosea]|uniref:Enoyl-CoA hydratase-related protein n=1 Tax=Saccharopolyspora rosea TaxID=524884 RepID=A0ABW3FUD0_9PSEU|nr:enoyl-CoA hydratase-related protein [Saccharopolyspora rosea]
MTTDQRVSCAVRDGVADVRLDRADKHNALDQAMFDALVATGLGLRERRDVRAVVLSGNGPSFCAGLDFGNFQAISEGSALDRRPATAEPVGPARARGQQAAHVWATLPVPVVAAVHGVGRRPGSCPRSPRPAPAPRRAGRWPSGWPARLSLDSFCVAVPVAEPQRPSRLRKPLLMYAQFSALPTSR